MTAGAIMTSYQQRALEMQPALYMTLGGLVQSLAFTYLMTVLFRGQGQVFSFDRIVDQVFWIRFMIAFEVILLVWHEYVYGLIYFKWEWDFWDSCIPFVMGAAEYYLSLNVLRSKSAGTTMSDWYWAMFGVALVGLFSYVNQWMKASRDLESRFAYSIIKRDREWGMVGLLVLASWFAYSAHVANGVTHTPAEKRNLLLIVLGITTAMLILTVATHAKLRSKLN
jgi:hypothetical protein